MDKKQDNENYNLKSLCKYISTVVSWTVFVLLVIVGILLIYYYISVRLYATKGEKYEPKFSVYTIVSQSMEPTINVYDVIVNTKVDDINDVKINDVITFISTWKVTYGMTITHRVVGTKTLDDGSTCLVTRGDNNTQEDEACVKESNLIGVVRAVIPGLGKIQSFLSSGFGWIFIVIIPAIYIIIKDIFKLVKLANFDEENENKDNKDKKDEDKKSEENPEEQEKLPEKSDEKLPFDLDEIDKEIAAEENDDEDIEEEFHVKLKEDYDDEDYDQDTELEEAYEELKKVKNDKD